MMSETIGNDRLNGEALPGRCCRLDRLLQGAPYRFAGETDLAPFHHDLVLRGHVMMEWLNTRSAGKGSCPRVLLLPTNY